MPRMLKLLQGSSRRNKTNEWLLGDIRAEDIMILLSLCAWERTAKPLPGVDSPYYLAVSSARHYPFMSDWLKEGRNDGWCNVFQVLGKKQEREAWETYSYG
jgi:hypothetical protein